MKKKIGTACLLIAIVLMTMVLIALCSYAPTPVIVPTDIPPTPISATIPVPTPTTAPTPTPPQAPIVVPSYVVPIEVLNENGRLIGAANAFLVDKEKGQFATNAHVIAEGVEFRVMLNGIWYPVEIEGINWWADTAIVKLLGDIETISLPEAVSFAERPRVGDILYIRGYVFEPETGELSIIPHSLNVEVIDVNSDWAITFEDYAMRALYSDNLLRDSIREGTAPEVPNILKHRYYENYVLVERIESSGNNMYFQDGVNGTPIYTDKGRVVAMISNIDGEDLGLAVPAEEIVALLAKVNSSLERLR